MRDARASLRGYKQVNKHGFEFLAQGYVAGRVRCARYIGRPAAVAPLWKWRGSCVSLSEKGPQDMQAGPQPARRRSARASLLDDKQREFTVLSYGPVARAGLTSQACRIVRACSCVAQGACHFWRAARRIYRRARRCGGALVLHSGAA